MPLYVEVMVLSAKEKAMLVNITLIVGTVWVYMHGLSLREAFINYMKWVAILNLGIFLFWWMNRHGI